MTDESGQVVGVEGDTGSFLLLGKQERLLIREIMSVILENEGTMRFIEKKFGKGYVKIGNELLKKLGG